jgi:hypothetical protein
MCLAEQPPPDRPGIWLTWIRRSAVPRPLSWAARRSVLISWPAIISLG